MAILIRILPLLIFFSLLSRISASIWNEGLVITRKDYESKTCQVTPLGPGKDDTDNVLTAISQCGTGGITVFSPGNFNITRKMAWNLTSATVELNGYLNFKPNIQYWLNSNNTYRVVFIQDQASWFVISGQDFVIDAFNTGGIQGNGQPWWEYFQVHSRSDGDGRPISLTVYEATNAVIRNFRIESPPFWSNTVANSYNVTYDGMLVNATNTNATFYGKNIVPNTDGIDTYRADNINLLNWDVTNGDDCVAIKGNSTNIVARNITCRGGDGIAFGSLGQYDQLYEIVANVSISDLHVTRINSSIQPFMVQGVYFKTWDASVHGTPPTGGGGGNGTLTNVTISSVVINETSIPLNLYQTNSGQTNDTPSYFQFSDITFKNWSGTAKSNTIVSLACSSNAPCLNMNFIDFDVSPPTGEAVKYICQNVISESGLNAPCNSTGEV